MVYELQLAQFQGPLDKLLELVEEKKLPVGEISLAKVTNDFLLYVKKLGTLDPALLAGFIDVASRLILIKSKSLLPHLELTSEEAADIKDLEARLRLYGECRPAQKLLLRRWRALEREYARPYLLGRRGGMEAIVGDAAGTHLFHPGAKLQLLSLTGVLEVLFAHIARFIKETDTVASGIMSVEEKIQEIVSRLSRGGGASLMTLTEEKSRSEIIVTFLALLHLAREYAVALEQRDPYADIIVRKTISNE